MKESVRKLLDRAWAAYDKGCPFMPDEVFDYLSIKYDYNDFGSESSNTIQHPHQMYSLKKVYDEEPAPYKIKSPIKTPKLDGTAISLVYDKGYLIAGIRRGRSGETSGEDVTDKIALLVPKTIEFIEEIQIDGEVVCDKSINNARNYASGSFTLKSLDEFRDRAKNLTYVAYGLRPTEKDSTYCTDMASLHREGFKTVMSKNIAEDFRTDGEVIREDSNKLFIEAGYTSKHPRGAYARKQSKDVLVEQTKLTDVVWQVGRTGQITPVAIFEEIIIDDAKITRATLHNPGFIEEHELSIGNNILVTRSGGIIPKVLGKVDAD